MPDKVPFEVDPYAPTEEVLPEDILEPHPRDDRSIEQQLKDNLVVKITPTEVSFKDHFEF